CTVITTVADQVFPLRDVVASRFPMWITFEDEPTLTVAEAWLLAALSSGKAWLPVSVWLPSELPVVFQANVSVADAPAARPGTVCVPMVAASVTSWSVTSKLTPTFWLPTFLTVTPTLTLAPWVTFAGAETAVTAMSVVGAGGGGGAPPSTVTLKRVSTRSIRL